MRSARENEWSANAEMAMQGFTVPVESREHLDYMIRYICRVLNDFEDISDERAEEILNNAWDKYNEKKSGVKFITVNSTMFGNMLTFVRQDKLTKKDGTPLSSGVLAWVENFDAPDCSELGYVAFQTVNGKTRRVG